MTYTHSSLRNREKGFTPILILVLVFAVFAVIYFIFMSSNKNSSVSKLYTNPSPTVSASPKEPSLEIQLNETQSTDPAEDFKSVDTDINNY